MNRTYVAIDLETTGLDPERDRITEIGAVRFSADGNVLETFESLVNPGREIPFFVEELTGVTNAAVRQAPRLLSVADDFLRFLGEDPVVGQNISFDLGCLRREGLNLRSPAIDTAHLSRILMPGRRPRGLMDLADELQVAAGVHHRALPDARTAADIFVALRKRALALPDGVRVQLARLLSLENLALAEVIGGEDWASIPITERQLPTVRPAPPVTALAKREPPLPISPAEVRRVFAAARHALDGYEERPQQMEMSAAVGAAMANGGHWLIEAGTGVGKSLAYLVPAALHALKNGERVVVSTNTINLQEQLFRHDIPALRRMLVRAGVIAEESELRATVLKGRSNYLCLRRWISGYGAAMGDSDFARLGSEMLLWLPETETGDRSELNLDSAAYATWQRFSAQDTECLSRPNSFVKDGQCFLQRARKAAEGAHILIVNHALLLADIASGGSALPAFDHLIVDEAHNLEEQATQQFGGNVSRRALLEVLDGLHRRATREQREGGVASLLKAFPEGATHNAGRTLEAAVAAAVSETGPAFEALGRLVPRNGEEDRLLITRGIRAGSDWEAVETAWQDLDRALQAVATQAEQARRTITDTPTSEDPDVLAGEIESAGRKVEEVRLLFDRLVGSADDNRIVWAARDRDGTGTLNMAPLDVGPTLKEQLFEKRRTVIATSATLSAAGSMAYTARRLGLDEAERLQLGSPFDYESSTLLAAFTDVPEPADPGYNAAVAAAIVRLARASDGRALALFTSHAALRQVAELARGELRESGIALLAQGIDGSPRQLTENLISTPNTVVLGTSSFWEGVDIRGDALSMLIIARLPFAVPTDPVYRARSEQYDDPFGQYSLPAAILRFRQGFGRLIRDRSDRGVVAVLDRRVFEKRYGQDFVNALPPCTRIRADTETVALRAREWLAR
jgi:DNA polymerase-3 subunit epsilon/ATP-dependent DNA helicase DinG